MSNIEKENTYIILHISSIVIKMVIYDIYWKHIFAYFEKVFECEINMHCCFGDFAKRLLQICEHKKELSLHFVKW